MGLETASFISGLTPAWPLAGDTKSQGDDHLRLIKSVLQATFPNATKAFYFPTTESISGTQTLDATDNNNTQFVDTSGGNVTLNLPSGLGTSDKGWTVDVVKTTSDTNAVIVTPASGTILTQVGSVATVRVGILCEPATFRWTGSAWHCYKPGAAIGSTYEFDNALPAGYMELDGSSYSNTAFAELFAYLGSSTLKDKSGRLSFGRDASQLRLSTAVFGADVTAVGSGGTGAQTRTLTTANLPPYTPAGTITNGAITIGGGTLGGNLSASAASSIDFQVPRNAVAITASQAASTFTGTPQGGTSTGFSILPPGIIVRKCIRAC